jgi:hypothetical protein
MNFLYPGFLFSLLAVAIPILIHLFNFRKFQKVYFSNVQFLTAAHAAQVSRSRLKDLLILVCRIFAVAFLVMAFAQPYLSSDESDYTTGGKLINIYIDNSYSMAAVNKEGSLFDEARRSAKEIVQHSGPNDKFRLTTNDFEGKHQRLVNAEELISMMDELQISGAQRTLQQVYNRIDQADPGHQKSLTYILSDFQKNFTGHKSLSADKSKPVIFVRIPSAAVSNIAADSVWSLTPAHRPGTQEKFVVQLHNYGEAGANDIPLKLMINNQQKAVARIHIPAGKTIRDTLIFSGLSAGWQKGIISIKDYPVVFDDELLFSFKVNSHLKVLQISADPGEKYISTLFAADPYFQFSSMAETSINYSGFAAYDLIILSGLKNPSSGLAQQLKSYAQNGGNIVVFPDLECSIPAFSAFLRNLSLPPVASLNTDSLRVTKLDLKNTIFDDVFENIPGKIDLPRLNRHFNYANINNSTREDIMQLPMGQAFFSSYPLAAGRIYLSAVSLKKEDSNLAEHPLFVPLLYKIAFNSIHQAPLYTVVGNSTLPSPIQLSLNPSQSLRLKSSKHEIIPQLNQQPGKTMLYIADQVKEAGFYELLKETELLSIYAFNDTRLESDMHYSDNNNLQQLYKSKDLNITDSTAAVSLKAVENNHTELWKLCLVLCAVFLFTEVLLIRFFNNLNYKKT